MARWFRGTKKLRRYLEKVESRNDPNNPHNWKIVSYGKHETETGRTRHNIVDSTNVPLEAFDSKREARRWLSKTRKAYRENK